MCSVAAGLTALSGYMSYQQQQAQADAQASRLEAQAKMYDAQAKLANNNATAEGYKQEQIADKYAQQNRALTARRNAAASSTRAQAGAAGLGIDSGTSALDILTAGEDAYRTDYMNLMNNQRNENYSSRVAQTNDINTANAYTTAASNNRSQAASVRNVSPWPTLVATAAQIYGMGAIGGGAGAAANTASITSGTAGTYTTAFGNIANSTPITFTNTLKKIGTGYSTGSSYGTLF